MKFLIHFFFLLLSPFVFSQQSTDLSTEEFLKLQDKTRAFFNENIDSSFYYVTKIEKSNNNLHKAFASGVKAFLFSKKKDFVNSHKYYHKALHLIESAPNSYEKIQNKSYIINYGGIIDWGEGKFSEALDKYFVAKKLSESINDLVQIVKINNNIALIESDAGNFKRAIAIAKQSDILINKNKTLYSESQYFQNKSNVNFNLGKYFEDNYYKNQSRKDLLDSAFYYFNKTIEFSDKNIENKIKALNNIGNIYFLKGNYRAAEKIYYNVVIQANENNLVTVFYNANFCLGYIYYRQNSFKKALVCFQKIKNIEGFDASIYVDYMYANYFLAKIYAKLNNSDKSIEYSKIYTDFFKKNKTKMNKEILEINFKIGHQDIETEMNQFQKEFYKQILLKKIYYGLICLIALLLLSLFIFNYKKRKIAEKKIIQIINDYKINAKNEYVLSKVLDQNEAQNIAEKITISEHNEKELMKKLKDLEHKKIYLKPEFTQQEVAKKIKTNTTYLSYIVNKNYNKSFSVYYNELRINYVIGEILNNKTYRSYSTQAIAESAGFKNADSFTSSFKKRTGVTPFQFINEIKKRELIN